MSCHFSIKSKFLLFLQRSIDPFLYRVITSCIYKRDIRLFTKCSKIVSCLINCQLLTWSNNVFPGTMPVSLFVLQSSGFSCNTTNKPLQRVLSVQSSAPHQSISMIFSPKKNITKSHTNYHTFCHPENFQHKW